MCEGLQKWAEELGEAGYKDGYEKGMNHGMQQMACIFAELLAGTSKKNVCKKLGVKMRHVDAAYKILHAK